MSNVALVHMRGYAALLAFQTVLYLWGYFGFQFREKMKRVRFGLLGYFWVAMNLAFLVGFWQYLSGRRESAWQRVE